MIGDVSVLWLGNSVSLLYKMRVGCKLLVYSRK